MAVKQVVIYTHTLKNTDAEKKFLEAYKMVAKYFINSKDALSFSVSHKGNNVYVIHSIWANGNKANWNETDNSLPENIRGAIKTLKSCYAPDSKAGKSKPQQLIEKIF